MAIPKFKTNDVLASSPLFNGPPAEPKNGTEQEHAARIRTGSGSDTNKKGPGAGQKPKRQGPQAGLQTGYTRATLIIKTDTLQRLKNLAYTERRTMKDTAEALLSDAITREEKRLEKNGNTIIKREGN